MKYFFFILGKDWELSLAELSSFLTENDFKGKIIEHTKNCAIVKFNSDKNLEEMGKLQEILGGIQKIGKIILEMPKKIMIKSFPFKIKNSRTTLENRAIIKKEIREKLLFELISGKEEDFFFAFSIYPALFAKPEIMISKAYLFFNKLIKSEIQNIFNIKTSYFKYPEKNLKNGQINPIWPHNVINYSLLEKNAAEIVLLFSKSKIYFGKTIAVDNPNLNKMIDELRPHAPFSISTSPKISKILINLAMNDKSGTILDCFCGSGTILMMALLRNLDFFGTDIEDEKVNMTRNNLTWLSKKKTIKLSDVQEKVFQLDARKLTVFFKPNTIDAIVTEPYLGPLFKKNPSRERCNDIIQCELIPLFRDVFNQFHTILKNQGKIALTTPVFLLKNGKEYGLNIDSVIDPSKFKLIKLLPKNIFVDFRPQDVDKKGIIVRKRKKFIFRKISVLMKI
ncbi:MAG: TRM11 family SAM-dependent methyltransferase [Candidatus Helarchaeota archaeon]